MASVQNIVITIVVSLLIMGVIGAWVAYKNGEIRAPLVPEEETVPLGPLDASSNEFNIDTTMDTQTNNPRATLKTNQGDIVLELFADQMPITVGNFVKLAEENFYDGTKFHRVIDNFMIQGGDPNSKGDNANIYGQGGPGYTIQDEFVEGELLTNVRGTIAMANTGQPNSGGSQFFINVVDNTGLDFNKQPLSSKHPVFGRVVAGMDIVDLISKTETGVRDIPVAPVIIEDIVIEGA